MKGALAFFLFCAVPVFSQSVTTVTGDSSRCLPRRPGPFPSLGVGRPETDEYVYPRYFQYVKEWDKCFSEGKWPASKIEQFPNAFPVAMEDAQRRIVTLTARDWEPMPEERLKMAEAGTDSSLPGRTGGAMSWLQMQKVTQQRKQDEKEREEREKLIDSGLEQLKSRLGEGSFRELNQYAYELFHVVPGRRVMRPITEAAMYSRYLRSIALMDKFAASGGEDGQAAASARAEEQKACGLNDREEAILQQVADDLQKDIQEHRPGPVSSDMSSRRAGEMGRPMTSVGGGPEESGIRVERSLHIEQLKSELGDVGFAKIDRRVHVLYESEGLPRVVPLDAAETQSKVGEQASSDQY